MANTDQLRDRASRLLAMAMSAREKGQAELYWAFEITNGNGRKVGFVRFSKRRSIAGWS
jgi:hypothetical protein